MLTEYKGVVPLLVNPKGWRSSEVRINHDFDPYFTPEMQAILKAARAETILERVTKRIKNNQPPDFNAPKAAVRSLLVQGDNLIVHTALTDYFVLWGLPRIASDSHKQALNELGQKQITEVPMGISTHNVVLLTSDGSRSADKVSVVMIVNDPSHGFAPGRLSISYEGQMDPTKDVNHRKTPSTFITVVRTLREEFGIGLEESPIKIDHTTIRLLAVCAEIDTAYTSWCHAIWINADPQAFVQSHQSAPRRRHADAILTVPLNDISAFTQDSISYESCCPHIINGSIAENAVLTPHPTVRWRIDALEDHMAYLRDNNLEMR